MTSRRSLHESDFYAWSLEQAALLRAGRIVDDGLDFAAMADDACVLQQALGILGREAGDFVEVEVTERGAEVFALGQDGFSSVGNHRQLR